MNLPFSPHSSDVVDINPTRLIPLRSLIAYLAVLALPVLAGCSAAPGMSINNDIAQPGITPVLKEITPDLVKQERAERDSYIDKQVRTLFADPKPYTIGINDVISVTMLGQTSMTPNVSVVMAPIPNTAADSLMSTGYEVDSTGEIFLPYVGAVKVVGLTERELHDLLVQRYKKYIKKPELIARVESYRSKRLYIDGEVRNPGVLPIIDIPMTLPEALSRAGGATSMGDTGAVSISRAGKNYRVDVPQLAAHGVDPSRIMLQSGDLVRVPPREESQVYVLGDVTKPTVVLPHNGRITLNEAMGVAGGVSTASGDPRQIYVIRNTGDAHPLVFHLDAASPVSLALAAAFELQPRDVVYVDATPLTRWNRVVNLILPSAQLVVDSKYLSVIK
jgi:polysaccharide export outer membrane protein